MNQWWKVGEVGTVWKVYETACQACQTFLIKLLAYIPPYPYRLRTMVIHAHKRGDESNDALQQRFKRQVQKTGLMKVLRGLGAYKKKPTRRLARNRALKREEYRAKNRKKQFYSNM